MHAEDHALGVVFETSMRMLVPLFQRPYVWNQDENWEPLWEALVSAAEHRSAGKPRPHFLGAVVLDKVDTYTGEVSARQLIDGQQRLTTLQILIAAVRDLAAAKGAAEYQEAFKRLSENYVPSKKDPDSIYKVWPTNEDRSHFRRVMSAGSLDAIAEAYGKKASAHSLGHLLPDCYAYFYRQMNDWLGDGQGDQLIERLGLLLHAMKLDLVLVVVDLEKGDDAQLIFETLNALGTPLLPADLVKNFLFHRAALAGGDIEPLYHQHWKAFDEDAQYWRAKVVQGRLTWHRVDIFLAHYLTLLKADIVNMTHLFGEFREYCIDHEIKAADQLQSVRSYADVFRRFDEYPADSREGVFFTRLRDLDTSMVIPVLLGLLKEPQSEEDKNRFLDLLESYLVRRAVCCLTYKGYNRVFVELLRRLSKAGFSPEELRKFLLEREGDSAVWPTDDQFKKAFEETKIYKRMKQARTRMVLEAIEHAVHDGKGERITIHDTLTIEHVMPQKWRDHWPLPEGKGKDYGEFRDHMLHTFGNLSLVTNKLNPSLSNAPWDQKKAALLEHSALALNRQLQQHADWDEARILLRSRQMADVAIKVWPRPS